MLSMLVAFEVDAIDACRLIAALFARNLQGLCKGTGTERIDNVNPCYTGIFSP
jgi:hypothetical protein